MATLREDAITCSSLDGALPANVRSYEGATAHAARTGSCAEPRALVTGVAPESPADDAGFTPGCWVLTVDGRPLRDSIDWMWYGSDDELEIGYEDTEGDRGTVVLYRDEGEDWGFEFDGALYDGIRLCRNACTFCFMRQLPDEARDTLVLRDDDYRLSFLQGTFVTLTNITPADEARIIEQHISPLRFSLHCITPEVRSAVIGRHAQHGIDVAERLLDAGIELHAQIVLMPGVNDGEELRRTLAWAYAHPGILNVGIVPLGFTKHQDRFTESFNDEARARAVVEGIAPVQERAREERGHPWVYASDEFYRNAYPRDLLDRLPSASDYGSFDMFEDGIGIVRSFVDDWRASGEAAETCAQALRDAGVRVLFVAGCAQREFFAPLVEASPLAGLLVPLFVENDYFGGNVDVTGLLCGCDIARALREENERAGVDVAVVPKVVFNDDAVTLDDMDIAGISHAAGVEVHVVCCNASEFLPEIAALVRV
ncbi:MAG TPA: DUF512 domain-containing protein [Candidatus Aveggerthella stercoripullorum]|uniref:DUF512 domain-containing protein n=1 Tax=Candidatus Aveggerthella stercoripullorum TaxID=2840688 RepID=A0A9D1A0Y1_9ACTN|nr:DUF512 domain-containing protein [Candidatus Aveggerthella stercoripullorum]